MDSSPSSKNITLSYIFVAAGAVAAWLIYTKTDPGAVVVDADAFTVFAPFYIAAQAIERTLEPLAARWKNTTAEKVALKRARATKELAESPPGGGEPTAEQISAAASAVETAELALAKAKAGRAIPLWATASVLGLLACSALGLGLISAVSAQPSTTSEFVRTVDVLLTGLAVGAGTKPLHDLISRLEKAKENADPTT